MNLCPCCRRRYGACTCRPPWCDGCERCSAHCGCIDIGTEVPVLAGRIEAAEDCDPVNEALTHLTAAGTMAERKRHLLKAAQSILRALEVINHE